ncbi:hypothetical protein VNO80_27836 [Phaseolus coccineus]|uniref:Secreted protein n=1 Tax=Phaseolus coccineus TaxID=3886 RepID=A0AAN9LH61_PHACN
MVMISVMGWILFLRLVINAQSVRKKWILIFSKINIISVKYDWQFPMATRDIWLYIKPLSCAKNERQ